MVGQKDVAEGPFHPAAVGLVDAGDHQARVTLLRLRPQAGVADAQLPACSLPGHHHLRTRRHPRQAFGAEPARTDQLHLVVEPAGVQGPVAGQHQRPHAVAVRAPVVVRPRRVGAGLGSHEIVCPGHQGGRVKFVNQHPGTVSGQVIQGGSGGLVRDAQRGDHVCEVELGTGRLADRTLITSGQGQAAVGEEVVAEDVLDQSRLVGDGEHRRQPGVELVVPDRLPEGPCDGLRSGCQGQRDHDMGPGPFTKDAGQRGDEILAGRAGDAPVFQAYP